MTQRSTNLGFSSDVLFLSLWMSVHCISCQVVCSDLRTHSHVLMVDMVEYACHINPNFLAVNQEE